MQIVLPPKKLEALGLRTGTRSLFAAVVGLETRGRNNVWVEFFNNNTNRYATTVVSYLSIRKMTPAVRAYGWRLRGTKLFRVPDGFPEDSSSSSNNSSTSSSSSNSSSDSDSSASNPSDPSDSESDSGSSSSSGSSSDSDSDSNSS